MARTFGSVAFTPLVKELQKRHGSRQQYERVVTKGPEQNELTPDEIAFLEDRDSFYWATIGSNGWPYVQHRGGPKGFLRALDNRTLAFADYAGNKQYITAGNLLTDDRVAMIFVDYPRKARLKILGHARAVEGDEAREWMDRLKAAGGAGKSAHVERVFVIAIEAYDWNCPQYITPRYTEQEIESAMRPMHERLEKLEQENAALRKQIADVNDPDASSRK
jgi:predicted pyridoxine 5'-phosphate oxidase superfamily flavin-nucleotide-binding protein